MAMKTQHPTGWNVKQPLSVHPVSKDICDVDPQNHLTQTLNGSCDDGWGDYEKENDMDFCNAYRTFTDVCVILLLAILLATIVILEHLQIPNNKSSDRCAPR